MRWLPLLTTLLMPLAASAGTASDPAFLGIGMDDGPGFCSISSITPASPAQEAGVQFGDAIVSIDGVSTAGPQPCSVLRNHIVAKRPGEQIKLEARRGASRVILKATLSTRGEVLNRRLVGEPMTHAEVVDIDNQKVGYNLGESRGRTTIVGWFMLENCTSCTRVFDRINDNLRKRFEGSDNIPTTLAVTAPARRGDLKPLRKAFNTAVPLAVADMDTFDALTLKDSDKDSERIHFMVIDCRGIVRFVAPVAPDAEDLDAALDDVLAAAEQAEHQRTSRR